MGVPREAIWNFPPSLGTLMFDNLIYIDLFWLQTFFPDRFVTIFVAANYFHAIESHGDWTVLSICIHWTFKILMDIIFFGRNYFHQKFCSRSKVFTSFSSSSLIYQTILSCKINMTMKIFIFLVIDHWLEVLTMSIEGA